MADENPLKRLIYLNPVHPPDNRRVIALDIDLCSALGNDTNDILRIVALMTNNFSEWGGAMERLLDLLVNTQVEVALSKIKEATGVMPKVVFYTHKGGIVTECCRQEYIAITAGAGLYVGGSNTLAFRRADLSEGFKYLYNQMKKSKASTENLDEHSGLYVNLCRVGVLTWFISEKLGLGYAAPVYFTKERKDVAVIAKREGVTKEMVFLFDDNANHHARESGLSLASDGNMIQVQPYDFNTMGAGRRSELHRVLTHYFPITEWFKEIYEALLQDCGTSSGLHTKSIDPMTNDWVDLTQFGAYYRAIEPWCVEIVIGAEDCAVKRRRTLGW